MPKDRSHCGRIHEPAVKRKTALEEIGAEGNSVVEIVSQIIVPKKEKHQLKKEAFLQKLQTGAAPYGSKSHARRERRKAKEKLIGGELNEIQQAIIALDDVDRPDDGNVTGSQRKSSLNAGMIGEGKGTTLSAAQRRHALQLEQARQPLILSNPQFASNPFEAIRIHAKNTLIRYQRPS